MQLRRLFLILFIAFTAHHLQAQVNSPYSRYGLGNIFPATFGAANGMGGISAAYFTPTNINYLNPASYAELSGATFDVGLTGNVLKLETNTENFTSGNANLSYLAFGFPMLRNLRHSKFGLSFGLIPYSGFQYNILQDVPSDDPQLGTIEYNYKGDGSLYQVYGGLGYKFQFDTTKTAKTFTREIKADTIYKNDTIIKIIKAETLSKKDTIIASHILSFGVNGGDIFGRLTNYTYASFPDLVSSQTTKLTRDNQVNGGIYNLGLGYQRQYIRQHTYDKFVDYLIFRFGADGAPQLKVDGSQAVTWTNIIKNGNYEYITDTLYQAPDTSGMITLPTHYEAGFSFSFYSTDPEKNMFTLGLQYSSSLWSQYDGFQDVGNFGDSWRTTLSFELLPSTAKTNTGSNNQNSSKYPYSLRLGAYTGKSNLIIDDQQLTDYGMTAGVALPVGFGKQISPAYRNTRLNLFLNVGQRGNNDTIRETYFSVGVGFSLSDTSWFYRDKQD